MQPLQESLSDLKEYKKTNEVIDKVTPEDMVKNFTDKQERTWRRKQHDAVKNYKKAVHEVYNNKQSDSTNLLKGCEREEYNMYKACLESAIKMCGAFPPNYSNLINQILGTTYTDEELWKVVEPYVIEARKAIENYIAETRDCKRKFNKAQEMRKEMDEAKAAFENLMKPKQEIKPTFWQRVKRLFSRKK